MAPWILGYSETMRVVLRGLPCLLSAAALLPVEARADCATPTEVRLVVEDGDDQAEGTLEAPWRTLAHAIANTGPGACVLMGTGFYDEGDAPLVIPASAGGSAGNVWELLSFPAFEANLRTPLRIEGSFVRVTGFNFIDGAFVHTDDAGVERAIDTNTFAGTPSDAAIRIGGDGAAAHDNVVLLSGATELVAGVEIGSGTNLSVTRNRVEGAGWGVRLAPGDAGVTTGLSLEENVVVGGTLGVDLASAGGDASAIGLRANVVAGASEASLFVGPGVGDVDVLGNTFVGGAFAIDVLGGADVVARNNLFWKQTDAATRGGPLTIDTNLYGPDDSSPDEEASAVVGDPLFEGEAALDLRLREGSPAIDAGVDLGSPFEGAAPDLGALESSPFPEPEPTSSSSSSSGTGGDGAGAAPSGGSDASGGGGAGDGGSEPAPSGDGCSCAVGESAPSTRAGAFAILGLVLLAARRRGVRAARDRAIKLG